jgi:uncharacterized membrane protein YphA (DoxX/SURF4 family)
MAALFVQGGLNAWKNSARLAVKASKVTEPLEEMTTADVRAEQLVKANAGVQIAAGGLFALGVAPRVMSIVLGATLIPTTFAGHRFWEMDDGPERSAQQIHFVKNAAVMGGLIFAALDIGGRPSIFWRGRKGAEALGAQLADVTQRVGDRVDAVTP